MPEFHILVTTFVAICKTWNLWDISFSRFQNSSFFTPREYRELDEREFAVKCSKIAPSIPLYILSIEIS